jgi:DhnA family fructose-bisphosphate aldolase class Ia
MFNESGFLPDALMARITEMRVNEPDFGLRMAQARARRTRLAPSGRLNILAADHPARGVTKVGAEPLKMADRRGYLARMVRVLMSERVDGIMATMDVLEDLFILNGLLEEAGAPSLLDNKLVIGSLNRGGLAGSCWELDDPITGPTPETCAQWKLDGAKLLLRVCEDEAASLKTILECSRAITAANALKLPTFLEPLVARRTEKGWATVKDSAALARLAGVAAALGDSSRYLWLKLPYAPGYELVARSTTLPILLLGGEAAGDPRPFLEEVGAALGAGANVRGALVGRNVLYPGDEDPLAMAEAVGGIIHRGWTPEEALAGLEKERGRELDRVTKWVKES